MNMKTAQNNNRPSLVRGLGLWSAIAVVVGSMIGQAVFLVGSDMAQELGSVTMLLGAWAIGGVLVFFGVCCYAELGAAMPKAVATDSACRLDLWAYHNRVDRQRTLRIVQRHAAGGVSGYGLVRDPGRSQTGHRILEARIQ